jgi:hypothetical protein
LPRELEANAARRAGVQFEGRSVIGRFWPKAGMW